MTLPTKMRSSWEVTRGEGLGWPLAAPAQTELFWGDLVLALIELD